MKKAIAFLLVLCMCLSLCACGDGVEKKSSSENTTTTTTAPPIIESGLKKEKLFSIFSAPEEDYQEKAISTTRTEFSFRNDQFITQGVLCGEDVLEFSWTFPDIYAETYEEFGELVQLMQTDIYGFSEKQNSSVQIVLFTMVGSMLIGDTSLTMGDVVAAIVNGTEQKTVDWTWHVDLDTSKHTAIFHAKYRN